MAGEIHSFRDLRVYQEAFEIQQHIFELSKTWPREEKYALIDQIRRSSRSIGGNVAESWAKGRYHSHFVSKLTDADGELQETSHWLRTAMACGYISPEDEPPLQSRIARIGKMLGKMMEMPEKFAPAVGI
ncbi:MAG: four helix bundle protein [Limisphaerales bacterium]